MKIKETLLENGAVVIGVPIEGAKSVTILLGFKTGSRSESPKTMGASHFLEHMFFQGSEKRPSQKEIASTADRIGARYNGGTNKEYTYYYIQTTRENFDLAFDIVGDMITRPVLDEAQFQKEKGPIFEELHRIKDNPEEDIIRLMELDLYGDTPMGWEIIGTEESLEAMTLTELKKYYQEKYVAENLTIVVAGDLPENYLDLAKLYAEKLPIGEKIYWEASTFAEKRITVHEREVGQCQLSMMIPTIGIADPRKSALRVVGNIFGGYMSSRLLSEIRDKQGWAYAIQAFSENNSDNGYFGILGGIKKDKVEETVEIIKDQLLDFTNTVTDEEIERAVGNIKGSNILRFEPINNRAIFILLNRILQGKLETPESSLAEVEKLTKKEIITVAEEFFKKDEIYLSLLGPFSDEEKFARILQQ